MRQPVPFGKYLLLDRISVGGMAEVFKAKSYGVEGFEKIIAIKRILPTMGEDRDFIKMFIDEAKIAGQLAHANICQIFELGRIDGSHFIAMEYIWGKDLLQIQNRLRKIKQPMPIAMACFSIAKVLEGLDYAHRKRDPLGRPLEIVHRDCSPQNVLVSYEGEVKVIDFGIAKATSRNSRTMAGVLKGKFGYMSPEQVRGLPLDRRSDIFALGTMLYECLTSDRLFQGETDFSTLEKVRNVDIRPPRELNPNIPEVVEKVILKALAKDVDDRYQWCSEMLADLQAFLMSQDVVFTAKSLSGWLKEVFSSEIERERQQLEQYKRVGRDGLIAGVPAAVAKVDVVETLGEAGAPEGDATQLGGPDFEALEQMVNAAAQPSLARPQAPVQAHAHGADDDDDGEFGEEAPTEIFGELDNNPPGHPMPVMPAAGSPAPRPAPAAMSPRNTPGPSSQPPPLSRPPQPPPRPPTHGQPMQYAGNGSSGPQMPRAGSSMPTMDAQPGYPQAQQAQQPQQLQHPNGMAQPSPSHGYPAQPSYPQQTPAPQMQMHGSVPVGHPMAQTMVPMNNPMGQPMNALAQPGQNQGKTLMGAAPPPGLPNYSAQGYPQQHSGQMPGTYPPPGYPQHPSSPQMQGYPGYPSSGPISAQMPNQMGTYPPPYGSQQGYAQASTPNPMIDTAHVGHLPPVEGKRKSSIGRDVAIGVAIAALVLGGFLAVKFLVLDSNDAEPSQGSSTIATLRIAMPENVTAELYVDDNKLQAVKNGLEIPVTAGQKKIKLLGPNGARCEQEMKLPAGKITTVECIMNAGSATTPAAGSNGSAGSAGSAMGTAPATNGSGSSTTAKPDDKSVKPDDKAAADKAAADKAATDKAAADKAAADKAAADKAAKDKAASDKATGDKSADKAAADKADKAAADKADKADKAAADKADKAAADKAARDKVAADKADKAAADKAARDKAAADKIATGDKSVDRAAADKAAKDKAAKDKAAADKAARDKMPVEENPIDKAASQPSKGFLKIVPPNGAQIMVDGAAPSGAIAKLPLIPGKHKVMFIIGADKHTFSVTVKAGETVTLDKHDLQ